MSGSGQLEAWFQKELQWVNKRFLGLFLSLYLCLCLWFEVSASELLQEVLWYASRHKVMLLFARVVMGSVMLGRGLLTFELTFWVDQGNLLPSKELRVMGQEVCGIGISKFATWTICWRCSLHYHFISCTPLISIHLVLSFLAVMKAYIPNFYWWNVQADGIHFISYVQEDECRWAKMSFFSRFLKAWPNH